VIAPLNSGRASVPSVATSTCAAAVERRQRAQPRLQRAQRHDVGGDFARERRVGREAARRGACDRRERQRGLGIATAHRAHRCARVDAVGGEARAEIQRRDAERARRVDGVGVGRVHIAAIARDV
jgi:hypothetical protein